MPTIWIADPNGNMLTIDGVSLYTDLSGARAAALITARERREHLTVRDGQRIVLRVSPAGWCGPEHAQSQLMKGAIHGS